MVDENYWGSPQDLYVAKDSPDSLKDAWKRYASGAQAAGTPALVQINHPGRQSPMASGKKGMWTKNIAPSSVALNLGNNVIAKIASAVVFGTPREMTLDDINHTVEDFARAAELVHEAGFAGVQIHAAHGYLLNQFLSPHSNKRTDLYGGTPTKRAQIVVDVIKAIRRVVPSSFCISIKLNSADHQSGVALEETLEQIGAVVGAGIDLLEISGGTYEDPKMILGNDDKEKQPLKASTAAREAFFLDFAKAARKRFPDVKLMLTGGFRSREGMQSALEEDACDVIGIGRPSCVNPHFPKDVILNQDVGDSDAKMILGPVKTPAVVKLIPIPAITGGVQTVSTRRQ